MADPSDNPLIIDPICLELWMASSEVDQKALGNFAAATSFDTPFLSAMLYKVLGLSVMLSKKLLRARRLRRLDTTRETKSLQLYHHIIWLSREGLLILEEFVLPLIEPYVELKVLSYKLRASFYHIFVLFHNQPAIHSPGIIDLQSNGALTNGHATARAPARENSFKSEPEIIQPPNKKGSVATKAKAMKHPPGLGPIQPPTAISSFLLPAIDYTPTATACFNHASALAERLLPGSHPLRLSVKLEYAAYLYDCIHDSNACRHLAKQAIADVYNAQEGMDDEAFQDAAEIVRILGKMIKRGGKTSSSGSSITPDRSRSRSAGNSRSPPSRVPSAKAMKSKMTSNDIPPAVPNPTMVNPI